MDIGGFLGSLTTFDYIAIILLGALFVLGYIQGMIRQVLGLLAWLAAFVLAANIRGPLGDFLGRYWTSLAPGYSAMIAFGLVFIVLLLIANVIIRVAYRRTPITARLAVLDEIAGGVLAVVLGLFLLATLTIALDSFYLSGSTPASVRTSGAGQVDWIADFHRIVAASAIVGGLRTTLIPLVLTVLGPIVPGGLRALYP